MVTRYQVYNNNESNIDEAAYISFDMQGKYTPLAATD